MNQEKTHPPLPYRLERDLDPVCDGDETCFITAPAVEDELGNCELVAIVPTVAAARFIVRACNSFDDLLAVCQATLDVLNGVGAPEYAGTSAALRHAIARASEVQP